MAATSSREPGSAQQPPGRTRAARSAADVWTQIQAICREAMTTGRTIATIDRRVANRILDVRPNTIVRASDGARTPDSQGAQVTRRMVERVWHALASDGHASRIRDVLFFTYALVTEIPGVAVDNDLRGLHIDDWDLAMTPYQEERLIDATASHRRYWTLSAHPARYRVVDAVRDLDEDWWTTGGADLHAGDRVAIWKYKGSDDHRGIIAFGEVLTDPEIHDDDQAHWIDSDATAAALRVRVRYVIKPPEPLSLELAHADSVIRQLPVSRAKGGTAHHVTADQWVQLMSLVGGWPRPGAGEDGQASGWPVLEIQPTVAAYFTMLRAELAGTPYVKAHFNREVQAATGRSRRAVEDKFMNISAVLRDIGLPYIQGYKPYPNLQGALRTEVERFLAREPEIPRLLEEMPAPDLPSTVQLVEVDPPVMAPPGTSGRGQATVGVDYLERQARNRDVGLKGERLVVEHERTWLSAHGRSDLAGLVAHVPSTLGDGAGYDVSSFLLDGSPHHIEVKATRGGITAPFFLSASELRYALEHPGAYSIYRIFDLGPDPRFYKLIGDMTEILDLKPVSYQARVKAPGAHSAVQG
jgi:Protein NO VEIN, C-terminal/EVE domain